MTQGPRAQDTLPGPDGGVGDRPGSGEKTESQAQAAARERWRSFGAPALAAVTVAALCLGTLLGWLAFSPRHPGDDSAEAGFARDMSEHHAQAVQMSQLVMQRSEDDDVRRLAVDIDNNQNFERGQMAAWLIEWDVPRARGGERMAWMEGHDHGAEELPAGVSMPGMATPEELEELTDVTGDEAEVLYLQLMTTHHMAGVEMAEAVLDLGADPQVLAAAQRMVDAQTGEIRLMVDMLAERGSDTREDVSAWLSDQESGDAQGVTTEGHPGH